MNANDVQPRGCTNFRLRRLLRAVSRLYDAELAEAGVKGTQFSLLSHVVALEPVQPAELARRMGLDASTLTRNLRVLLEQGWVRQGPGADARSRLVESTGAGREVHARARRHWKRAQLRLNERLGVERVAALHALADEALGLLDDDRADGDGGPEG
ncbi:MAG TPA: MarR family winged helix-turn-helix transcriptional regulator [Burkholderiaceae bacterium]|nr:MarR family winged helix-turn-helix transcriptional regulator [Burkholderiaceae bacterium]